jgi:hypothetical protein
MSDDEVVAYVRDAGYDLDSFFRSESSSKDSVERIRAATGVELPSAVTSAVLHEFTDADGQPRMLARITVSSKNSRAWNRALQPSDSVITLPSQADEKHPWLPGNLHGLPSLPPRKCPRFHAPIRHHLLPATCLKPAREKGSESSFSRADYTPGS